MVVESAVDEAVADEWRWNTATAVTAQSVPATSLSYTHHQHSCRDVHTTSLSRKCSLLINVDKTTVMASDGIACRILIQNELLEQVDTFPYLGSLITEDSECMTEFRTRLNRGQAIEASLQKIWKSHYIPISTKIRLMKR